jgi:hypothetical protein
MNYRTPSKGPDKGQEKRASLPMRLNQAANELNPFLIIVAVGLMILNLVLYLGMSVSRQSSAGLVSHPYSTSTAESQAAPAAGSSRN